MTITISGVGEHRYTAKVSRYARNCSVDCAAGRADVTSTTVLDIPIPQLRRLSSHRPRQTAE